MKKRNAPGCPCCEEPPPGPCECSNSIRIDIYDTQDDIITDRGLGFSGCCNIVHTGFSAIDGSYFLDFGGTPDFEDDDYEYFILNTVLSIESPLDLSEVCPFAAGFECLYLRVYFRKLKTPDTCVGHVYVEFYKYGSFGDPCPEELSGTIWLVGPTSPLEYSKCEGVTGAGLSVNWAAPVPCFLVISWALSYDITNL